MKKILLVVFLLSLFFIFVNQSEAQKEYVPVPSMIWEHIEIISGSIIRIDRYMHPGGRQFSQGIHIIVKTKTTEENVSMGPAWFIDKNLSFHIRDNVKLSVFRITQNGLKFAIAKDIEILGEGKILRIRDEKGFPVWIRK